jgi:hypothetical protein
MSFLKEMICSFFLYENVRFDEPLLSTITAQDAVELKGYQFNTITWLKLNG